MIYIYIEPKKTQLGVKWLNGLVYFPRIEGACLSSNFSFSNSFIFENKMLALGWKYYSNIVKWL